jgi:uncharacterized protein (DUF362 family)/Pyruvate/2-oxoacid:ferredoxin oxidoreductase delta subunit
MNEKSTVFAATSQSHEPEHVDHAVNTLFAMLQATFLELLKNGNRALVKVNMGCSGARAPGDRYTTHPILAESVIRNLQRLGAIVSFGDDVARAGTHCQTIWRTTGMRDVADRTGACLLDFAAEGAREVRGSLLHPRRYFVSKAYFNADVVINLANLRSHADVVLSGALKNMFGMVIGKRKALIHHLFRSNPSGFGRAIADIHRVVRPHLSFLDLTTVLEGHGLGTAIRPVGVLLASTDAVALDTLAAQIVGYADLKIWPTYHAHRLGLGCSNPGQITVRHSGGKDLPSLKLRYPTLPQAAKASVYDRVSNFANNTLLRPRPVIQDEKCTGCAKCAQRCPAQCIHPTASGPYRIVLRDCADCGCCLKVCEEEAIDMQFLGVAKLARLALRRSTVVPSATEQIRRHVIQHLIDAQCEQTVSEVVGQISIKLKRPYAAGIVNEFLDDLVVQGLVTKTDAEGRCRYRWSNFAASFGGARGGGSRVAIAGQESDAAVGVATSTSQAVSQSETQFILECGASLR